MRESEAQEILRVVSNVLHARSPERPSTKWLAGAFAAHRAITTRFYLQASGEALTPEAFEIVSSSENRATVRIGTTYLENFTVHEGWSGQHQVMVESMELVRQPTGWRVISIQVNGREVTDHLFLEVSTQHVTGDLTMEVLAAEETPQAVILYSRITNRGPNPLHLHRLMMRRRDGKIRFGFVGSKRVIKPDESFEDIVYSSVPLPGESHDIRVTFLARWLYPRLSHSAINLGLPVRMKLDREFRHLA